MSIVLVASVLSFAVAAEPPPGWTVMEVPGRPAAVFAAAEGEIRVIARDGVAFLLRPLAATESKAERLAWRWQVIAAPPPSDLAEAGRDDRPLAVHLAFPSAAEGGIGRWFDRVLRRTVAGEAFSGRVLTYVWGGTAPVGTVIENPHLREDGRLIVLENGPAAPGRWRAAVVDFRADFARAFGVPAPDPTFIILSADTDDLGGVSEARLADLRFLSSPSSPAPVLETAP